MNKRSSEHLENRLVVLSGVVLVVLIILFIRLWYLQVLASDHYQRLAESNRLRVIPIPAERGIIYDRDGEILVQNRSSLQLVIPPDAQVRPDVLQRVAEVLGLPYADIQRKVAEHKAKPPFLPVVLADDISVERATFFRERQADYPGVQLMERFVRDYPEHRTGAHLLGYLGEISAAELELAEFKAYRAGATVGKTGVEASYEGELAGLNGEERVEVDAMGRPLGTVAGKEPRAGGSLVLTVDLTAQKAAEEALEQAVRDARSRGYENAAAGAAVVLDPNNGDVLALASYPDYDPAAFIGGISETQWEKLNDKRSEFPLQNRAVSGVFAPGSTFKPVVAVGGLAEGLIANDSIVECKGKWIGMGKKWAKMDWKKNGHGSVGLGTGIAQSCDIYFYEVGHRFYKQRHENLQKWARKFGLGRLSGIDLPSETEGRVPDAAWKKAWNKDRPQNQMWLPGDTVNVAIGQGDLLASPLQMAVAFAAIGNGGTLYRPHVVDKIVDASGGVVREIKPEITSTVEAARALRLVRNGLSRAATDGTARTAFAGFPLPVAGKTGTSQVAKKDDFSWFVMYAPAERPKYVVAVVVEQGGHGGSVAAPAARQILGRMLGYAEAVWRVEDAKDPSR